MNARQLEKLGIPRTCVPRAIEAIARAAKQGAAGKALKDRIQAVADNPDAHTADPTFGDLASALLGERGDAALAAAPRESVAYRTWGTDIDGGAHAQMREACSLPMATAGALMPDAHIGYGLPIGGVLALDNAVCPYAVGVDIACRMKLTLLDMPVATLTSKPQQYIDALERGTRFGVGVEHKPPCDHPVLDQDWTITRITREHADKARRQLGTSGSGNHFVEFGVVTLDHDDTELGLAAGEYVALLSHSGSRGVGSAVCDVYSNTARANLPRGYGDFGRLAWLGLDTEQGQEYWQAMNLMGDYAAANHDVIHKLVTKLLGAHIIAAVENHHNFAWKERHGGRDVIVHRKGATPAGVGVLGVIPGSMGSPAYVVRGKGNADSLHSASHGAGRRMSRTKAKEQYNFRAVQRDLAKQGITVLSAGADEVPYVYKDIHEVMAAQTDLVDAVARFDPRIVKMCGDGSKAED